MNRTAAVTIAGTVAVLVSALGATATADTGPDACQQAVAHVDAMVELHGQEIAAQAAYGIAVNDGMAKAPELLAKLRNVQADYVTELAAYQAAAADC